MLFSNKVFLTETDKLAETLIAALREFKIEGEFLKCLTVQNLVDSHIVSSTQASQLVGELRNEDGIELRTRQSLDQRMKEVFGSPGNVYALIVWMTGVISRDSFEKIVKRLHIPAQDWVSP